MESQSYRAEALVPAASGEPHVGERRHKKVAAGPQRSTDSKASPTNCPTIGEFVSSPVPSPFR
jgi:hypothetical protein